MTGAAQVRGSAPRIDAELRQSRLLPRTATRSRAGAAGGQCGRFTGKGGRGGVRTRRGPSSARCRCAAAATPGVEWKTPLSCRSRVRPPRRRRRARHAALAALPRRPLRRRRRAWGRCSLKRSPDTVPGSLTTRMHRLANRERAWPRRSGARPPRRRRRARHAVLAAPAVRCVRHAVPVPRGAFRHAVQRSSR